MKITILCFTVLILLFGPISVQATTINEHEYVTWSFDLSGVIDGVTPIKYVNWAVFAGTDDIDPGDRVYFIMEVVGKEPRIDTGTWEYSDLPNHNQERHFSSYTNLYPLLGDTLELELWVDSRPGYSGASVDILGAPVIEGLTYYSGEVLPIEIGGTFLERGFSTTWHDSSSMSTVPIPGTIWLVGSGIVGIVGIRKRFKL